MKILITGICGFVGNALAVSSLAQGNSADPNWEPATLLPALLDEIARHAEANPAWLEISGNA